MKEREKPLSQALKIVLFHYHQPYRCVHVSFSSYTRDQFCKPATAKLSAGAALIPYNLCLYFMLTLVKHIQ